MKIAVFGDLHGCFDAVDSAWVDAGGFDAVLLTGDLGRGWSSSVPRCGAAIAALRTPTWWVPGNHDGVSVGQLLVEVTGASPVGLALQPRLLRALRALDAALAPARRLSFDAAPVGPVWVVGGRPWTLGGPRLAFAPALGALHGVADLAAATARMVARVAEVAPEVPVLFLAHNGPSGLGGARDAPFGRDFRAPAVDWGDPDLATAVAAARNGRRLVVVVAGHMHHRLRGGGQRRTACEDGDLLVINAARVPRIEADGARHHVELEVSGDRATAWAVELRDGRARRVRIGEARRPSASAQAPLGTAG